MNGDKPSNPIHLARSLIRTGESSATVQWCLKDFDDSLRRARTSKERDSVARKVIRLYTKGAG